MRSLAELIMKGRLQAGGIALVAAAVPMFFWLSSAVVALVLLRRGWNSALEVLIAALIPAGYWALQGNPAALLVISAGAVLAALLRITVSWRTTLLLALIVGAALVVMVQVLIPGTINELSAQAHQIIAQQLASVGESPELDALLDRLQQLLPFVMAGVIAWAYLLFAVASLALARYWQSLLYNPGGFQQEFYQLRLPVLWAVALLAMILMGAQLPPMVTAMIPIASVPLFVAGLALLHGQVALRKMSRVWIYGLYLMLFIATQIAYPLIVLMAFLDSLFDFRSRAAKPQA
ncbi:hypothetical protein [Aestuariirhabdus litorea]|uniref:DUF2232 domain-containing protein n=1 Tax=Aestuariirhabdus litorea TaxID=2528527 RepID=A0A3P3VN94_9GAMM|nr:hypothetical protein [Aestuariirhabdus litorea]RRJ82303.1 hypothetical protein D0544_10470 [Aestuariirhabdus litorea]RWW92468.1 hypothetical protein DZC74_10450 [Endozoicomonadaceae bacterium GTF-13]